MPQQVVNHLFRHQYGKMVAILSRAFGLTHLETIEDAVQDTFIQATLKWRNNPPDNPEAWLTQAAKNRIIDLLRQVQSERERHQKISHGSAAYQLNEVFLDHEVEDSQLRMIFVACHPALAREDQIAFALKTISGFSMKEIAVALLQKEETIKKRLSRARKSIQDNQLTLSYPDPQEITPRLEGVQQVIYLIFNEGFHSTKADVLISKDLCGEAIRLCKLLLTKETFRSGSSYALFALFCLHSARLESKIENNQIIDLEHQDRSKWYQPLIQLGVDSLQKAFGFEDKSVYHYEAAIAAEHVRAKTFDATDWKRIYEHYRELDDYFPSPHNKLGMATVLLKLNKPDECKKMLESITYADLEQRGYLWYGCWAEYFKNLGDKTKASEYYNRAIVSCSNKMEREYLRGKLESL